METFDTNDLSDALRRVRESLDGFGNAVDSVTDPVRDAAIRRRRLDDEDKKERERMIAANKKMAASIQRTTNNILSYASELAGNSGSFTTLNTAINGIATVVTFITDRMPLVGGVLSGLTKATAEASKMMISQFEKGYKVFEQLSGQGLVNNFEELTDSMKFTGLNFQDTQKVLGRFSKELSLIGGTTILGRNSFQELAKTSGYLRDNFQKLGYSAPEFNESMILFMSQLQAQGNLRGKTETELRQATKEYLLQLEGLTRLTGLNRAEIQKQQDERMRNARFRASIQGLSPEIVRNLQNFVTSMGPLGDGFRDLTSGFVRTAEAQKVVQTLGLSGIDAIKLMQQIKSGALKDIDAYTRVQAASDQYVKRTTTLANAMGDETSVTAFYTFLDDLRKKGKITATEYDNLVDKLDATGKATDGQNADLARTRVNLYNVGTSLELLATSSEIATKSMSAVSTGMNEVIVWISETLGAKMSEDMKLRIEEIKADKKVLDLKKEQADLDTKINEAKETQLKHAKLDKEIKERDEKIKQTKEQMRDKNLDPKKREALGKELAILEEEKRNRFSKIRSEKQSMPLNVSETALAEMQQQRADVSTQLSEATTEAQAAKQKRQTYFEGNTSQQNQPVIKSRSINPALEDNKKPNIDDLLSFTSGTGSKKHFEKMSELRPDVASKFLAMATEYKKATGKKLTVTSSYRSEEEQKNVKSGSNPKAKGRSKHTDGRAIDMDSSQVQYLKDKRLLDDYGFKTLAGDPPHIYMKNGGVIKASETGTKVVAGEGGLNEAFVPLPDGETIPVTIKNSSLFNSPKKFNDIEDQSANMMNIMNTSYTKIQETTIKNLDIFNKINENMRSMNERLVDILTTLDASRRIQNNILNVSTN